MEFNKYQTEITEEELNELPAEIKEQFYDAINNIPFVRSMIDKDRPRAKDLPRDEEGKIIIDITKPHILEDTNYFRPSAIHYKKYGCYTKLKPNANPNSEYRKWLNEEVRRCWEGYIRESDGEWITGDMYFFLNYCPIQLIKKSSKGDTIRTVDFPSFFDGNYYRFHYLYQCRKEGHHAMELAKRGAGKSYSASALLAKRFILGESSEVKHKVQCVATASERKYIQGANQLLDMFQYYIDFNANNTEFPSQRLTSSLQNMQWTMGYLDVDTNTRKGTQNSVIGITSKDDESKLRGSRGVLYLLEEAGSFPRLLNLYQVLRPSVEDGNRVFGLIYGYGCVTKNSKVWTLDGRNITIDKLTKEDGIIGSNFDGITKEIIGTKIDPVEKECIKITLSDNNFIECSLDHPILVQKIHTPRRKDDKDKRLRVFTVGFKNASEIKLGDRIVTERSIPIFGNDALFDARLVGMLIGDGTYGINNSPKFSSQDYELQNYVENNYDCTTVVERKSKCGKIYKEIRIRNICSNLRNIGIYGQTKTKKRLPVNYQTLKYDDTVKLLAGLYDTDGCITFKERNSSIQLTQSTKEILEEVQILLRKLGIVSRIYMNKPSIKEGRKDKNPWYILAIKGLYNILNFAKHIPLLIEYKRDTLNKAVDWFNNNPSLKSCGFDADRFVVNKVTKIESLGNQTVYNLSAMYSRTYLVNNIITHNTSGDSASDFSSMQELMYNPDGYNIKGVTNVYDKEGQGRAKFTYFYPGYMNRADCYDEDGNSDVIKAILEILKDRYVVKYNSTDINAITKRVAEIPLTPQEAIQRSRGNIFPITELTQRLNEIDSNPNFYDDTYVGTLVTGKNGTIEFNINTVDKPIREFPTKDNKAHPYNTKVYTPEGIKYWRDIQIGDYIFGTDGNPIQVLDIPFDGVTDVYEIILKDGRTVKASGNHKWSIIDTNGYYKILSTKEMVENGWYRVGKEYKQKGYRNLKYFIPKNYGADYAKKDLPIMPYLLGLMLGDGCICGSTTNRAKFTASIPDMEIYKNLLPYYVNTIDDRHHYIHVDNIGNYFVSLGLKNTKSKTKFIPELYKFTSKEDRLELLRGILDTDGTIEYGGNVGYATISEKLAYDVLEVARSLGINCNIKNTYINKHGNKVWTLIFYTDIQLFHLPRKYSKQKITKNRSKKTGIYDIRYIGKELCKCVTVNSKDHCYLIEDYITTHNCNGALEIYEMPQKVQNKIPNERYIASLDNYENDESNTMSLGSLFVLDLWTDRIVAEYTGRPMFADDLNEIARKICLFYNCKLLYENNKKNTFAYFSRMNSLHLLADTPEYLKNKQLIKSTGFGNSSKGVTATVPIKNFGFTLIRDWLLKPVTISKEENGEPIEYTISNLHFIKNRALIKELMLFNPDINVDRIMSLVQLMLYREEKMILFQGDPSKNSKRENPNYLGNDDFFTRNYKTVNLEKPILLD